MFKRISISLIAGIVVFLVTFFALPLGVSEANIVAVVGSLLLDWSNRYFETMPSLLADYLAHASLALIALTAGLLTVLAAIPLLLGWSLLAEAGGWFIGLFRRGEVEKTDPDLPPIEMNSHFVSSGDGKEVLGRGLDTLERD